MYAFCEFVVVCTCQIILMKFVKVTWYIAHESVILNIMPIGFLFHISIYNAKRCTNYPFLWKIPVFDPFSLCDILHLPGKMHKLLYTINLNGIIKTTYSEIFYSPKINIFWLRSNYNNGAPEILIWKCKIISPLDSCEVMPLVFYWYYNIYINILLPFSFSLWTECLAHIWLKTAREV